MTKTADYVYRNQDDSVRIRIWRRETGRWDYDMFKHVGDEYSLTSFGAEYGDDFRTKTDAKADAERKFGKITSMGAINPITRGW